jgi:hypothetical protein
MTSLQRDKRLSFSPGPSFCGSAWDLANPTRRTFREISYLVVSGYNRSLVKADDTLHDDQYICMKTYYIYMKT